MKNILLLISVTVNIIISVLFFRFYNSFEILSNSAYVKSVLSSQHKTINDDVAINIIFGKVDSNFNLILTTITVLFGLFAFLTFIGVKEQFRFQVRSIKKKISGQETIWSKHKTDLLTLKGDLSYEIADKMSKDLTEMFDKEDKEYKDYVKYVEHTLVCCDYFAQSLVFKKDVYPKFKKSISSIIKSRLSIASELISTQTTFELDNLGYERFLRLQENINKVADLEDKQNLSLVFSKLSFPTLD